ncbi:MAG: family 20 glycosylhydrolase [Clostridia bacterium]|nr:family 20 glycosylhydrolase [Clostridia bacterium]
MTKQELLKKMLIEPKELILKEGTFKKDKNAKVFTNIDTDFSYLLELAGFAGKTENVYYDLGGTYVIAIGEKDVDLAEVDFYDDEEYFMDINGDNLVIASATVGGALLGLKAFIRMSEELGEMPQMTIQDYPNIPFRAVHTCVFRPDDGSEKEESHPEYIKKMIKTAAISGYNHIFVEFWGMFPYSLDYAHWPNAYTKEEIEDLVSFAIDKMHITPIPAQNLTSHAGWSRIITRKHTVLDQRPDLEDMYIPGGWCFATENPKTKEFIKTLIDELIAMFRNPPYLHCCCDKCFGFGSTEEDRTMSADVLFAKHISFLNSYLSEKNVRMVMWGDMLYSSMDALYWKCNEKTADLLPKNILINIWTHNNPGKNWQDAAYFEEKGFETVYSPFINEESIESMVEVCRNRGSHGMVQTTWHKPQTAVPYVILTGALQWCGKRPEEDVRKNFADTWYK